MKALVQMGSRYALVFFFGLALLCGLTSCGFLSKKTQRYELPTNEKAPAAYTKAALAVEEHQWAEAEKLLGQFLMQNPTTRWQRSAEYLLGLTYEAQDNPAQALEKYRGVAQDAYSPPEVQAQALFRSSFCWEALGTETEVIAALVDVWGRRKNLPVVTREAELPARLAAAYARRGNLEEADRYFKMAEEGLIKLRSQAGEKMPDWLGRTFYTMGHISASGLDGSEFQNAIRPIPRAQAFLVRASATEQKPYAELAQKDIADVYQKLLGIVETGIAKLAEKGLVDAREVQRSHWDHAAEIYELIRQMRSHLALQPKRIEGLYQLMDKAELRVQRILVNRPVGDGLTPEALGRLKELRWKTIDAKPLGGESQ